MAHPPRDHSHGREDKDSRNGKYGPENLRLYAAEEVVLIGSYCLTTLAVLRMVVKLLMVYEMVALSGMSVILRARGGDKKVWSNITMNSEGTCAQSELLQKSKWDNG